MNAGVDEAGRGSLLSRVYAAAVILPDDFDELCKASNIVLKDSKKMSVVDRNRTRKFIETHAVDFGVGFAESEEIDKMNILQATMFAMHRALSQLSWIDKILVDGNYFKPFADIPYECIIGGDDKEQSISAASILAKTYRDEYVELLVDENPILEEYGVRRNKGYGTEEHRKAVQRLGLTPFHRRTFCKFKNKMIIDKLK
jgi:ribonuclease HII